MIKIICRVFYKVKWKIYELLKQRSQYYSDLKIYEVDDDALFSDINSSLNQKKSFCMGKIGGSECYALSAFFLSGEEKEKAAFDQLCNWSGFFPRKYDRELLKKYIDIQLDAIRSLDVIENFPKCYEEWILKKYKKQGLRMARHVADPWAQEIPWTKALEGKKVLVIHPFAELIEKQYENREKLFENQDILPKFSLSTLKAVQSLGGDCDGPFGTWFDALEYMKEEIKKADFDVALLGCGAYGLPLAAEISKLGKVAVHMGGGVQILFGIRGNRWDTREDFIKLFNEYWVYPGDEYKPKNFKEVENGCYW